MEMVGKFVIYIIMVCAVVGAIASIKDSEQGLGKQFMEGLHTVGHIFIPADENHSLRWLLR